MQGLDRYAYVGNNPVRNIDPTGHKCVGDPGECEGIHGYGNDPWPPPSEMGPYVTELYNDYIYLRDTPSPWNGNQAGVFTIWDFIDLLLSMEFGYAGMDYPPDVLKQLVVRNFYRLCGSFCDPSNPYDVLRWLALRNIKYDRGLSPGKLDDNWKSGAADKWNTTNFASAFQYPDPLWKSGCGDGNVPCEWGNKNVDATVIGSLYTQQQLLNRISDALALTPLPPAPPSTEINSFYLQAGGGATQFIATEGQFQCIYYGIGYQCPQ